MRAPPLAGIAALGQLALAVQIQVGISKGELDPDAPRVLEEGRKQLELEKVFALMTGGGRRCEPTVTSGQRRALLVGGR